MSTNLNEQNLKELFQVLEDRGGTEYTLGFLFQMVLSHMDLDPRLQERVTANIATVHRLNREYKIK